jgi:restriction system protein
VKLEMHKNSLFAILLRSPWWISFAIAGAMFAGLRLLIPWVYAAFMALPFLVIACYAAWKQLRAPSAETVDKRLEKLREADWEVFSADLESAFRREGYGVASLSGAEADLELTKGGRTTLVACKRWKAARAGVEPLRQLLAARRKREAHECIYVAAGEVSDNARSFAAENSIRLLHGAELASLLK